jgi:hypothetical protein
MVKFPSDIIVFYKFTISKNFDISLLIGLIIEAYYSVRCFLKNNWGTAKIQVFKKRSI